MNGFTIDLSSFNGQNSVISSTATVTKTFTTTPPTSYCGMTCTLSIDAYKITVSGPNPTLITLSDPTTPTISFAASTDPADAGVYVIAVQISADTGATWSAPTNSEFTYVNGFCAQTTIAVTNTCPAAALSVNIGSSITTTIAWTISNTTQNYLCG